jgi:preprotein translocase subunit SecE
VNDYTKLAVWVLVIGVAFGFLWRKGYLLRISQYVSETKEELKKCSWPSKEELKGSTVVILITIALMGLFTVSVDFVLATIIRAITS